MAIKQIKLGDLPRSELRMIEVRKYLCGWGQLLTDILGRNRFAQEVECES